jgi:hypothetical protein
MIESLKGFLYSYQRNLSHLILLHARTSRCLGRQRCARGREESGRALGRAH